MKKDKHETPVIFRMWPKHEGGSVDAYFPYEPTERGNPRHVCCYAHVGQHGGADYCGCIAATRPATADEYADLAKELESLGYRLKVIKRANRDRMATAYKAMMSR